MINQLKILNLYASGNNGWLGLYLGEDNFLTVSKGIIVVVNRSTIITHLYETHETSVAEACQTWGVTVQEVDSYCKEYINFAIESKVDSFIKKYSRQKGESYGDYLSRQLKQAV